ncbi:ubiquitin family protein [Klebsormidium nitens]|uniref:Ubiquitin family protein n=1 Tax=Klebsormidium nitens TaxID=105231 RepID=A0A1Y1I7N6_KLENI|nr:ubiquitin family protein [Klebsormidium nitens]|eukprot:GAQ85952.1 ubiquitin family protein [Klebsormidium nitens]
MSMYVRVKHKKVTYFLHVEPSDSILEVKEKLQALSEQPVDQQRLTLVSTGQVLEDGKTLAEQKVENDAVVALQYKLPDSDQYEEIDIQKHDIDDTAEPHS